MRFLFIYPAPGLLGGIETLIARMSRWLIDNGHEVSLLMHRPENWIETLPKGVQWISLNGRFSELYYYFHARRFWESSGFPRPDVIKSFDLGSSWIACQLAASLGSGCKVISGIYNSFVFKWYYSAQSMRPWSSLRLYLENYLRYVPDSARLFCGADQIEELQEVHRRSGVLWPIPMDTTAFEPAVRNPRWGRIVSVGRLSAMKEYNLYMIDVVKGLRRKGHPVTWSVYGTGPYEPVMRSRIQEEGLQDVIFLEGTVPYHRFRQALADAYVFVGMGTSLLEAAMFGVPNVYALPYDRAGLTYGPVYRDPSGSIGPSLATPPRHKVIDEIERILRLGPEEYQVEQDLVCQHVQPHQVEASMGRFLELVRRAEPIKPRRAFYLANYPRWLIHRMVRSCRQRLGDDQPVPHPEAPLFAGTK